MKIETIMWNGGREVPDQGRTLRLIYGSLGIIWETVTVYRNGYFDKLGTDIHVYAWRYVDEAEQDAAYMDGRRDMLNDVRYAIRGSRGRAPIDDVLNELSKEMRKETRKTPSKKAK